MLAAVYLDNCLPVKAVKVQNEILKWCLPAKFEACEPAMAQQPPHRNFGAGRLAPQLPRVAATALRDGTVVKPDRH
jgi:hypothetical protein